MSLLPHRIFFRLARARSELTAPETNLLLCPYDFVPLLFPSRRKLKAQQDRDNAALEAKKADAQKIATALSIAKNFTIKKEANEENAYGSVTMTELKDAIKKQTTLDLADDVIDLPAIKELGVFTVTANLHPEVKQDFTVTVEKA